jgi:hypothetical protein
MNKLASYNKFLRNASYGRALKRQYIKPVLNIKLLLERNWDNTGNLHLFEGGEARKKSVYNGLGGVPLGRQERIQALLREIGGRCRGGWTPNEEWNCETQAG